MWCLFGPGAGINLGVITSANVLMNPGRISFSRIILNNFDAGGLFFKRHAGHSKWANIRHTKLAKDAEKSKLVGKYIKMMEIALRDGGGDPIKNPKLKQVIDKALEEDVPRSSVDNFLKKVHGKEGNRIKLGVKGPGGSLFVVTALTSQAIRFKQIMGSNIKKLGGVSSDGVLNCFDEKGIILSKKTRELDDAMNYAIEAGAEDVEEDDIDNETVLKFTVEPRELTIITSKLEKMGFHIISGTTIFIPQMKISLAEDDVIKNVKLYEKIRSDPDVLDVFDNIL